MSDEKTNPDPTKPDPKGSASRDVRGRSGQVDQASEAQAGAAGAAWPPGDADQLPAEVETLKGQVADLTERLLRAHAEMDNMRKRHEREKEEVAKYAITKFAQDVINVGDNFQRAISAVPIEAAEQDPALKSFLEGVTLAEREFLNTLERHGVKRIDPQGEPFNPHFHQAVVEVQNAEVAPGTVLRVLQAGYTIEDRVLRPAMVTVAKGGPKSAKAPPAAGGTEPAPNGGGSTTKL